jgi:hypothetical protein
LKNIQKGIVASYQHVMKNSAAFGSACAPVAAVRSERLPPKQVRPGGAPFGIRNFSGFRMKEHDA